MGGPVTVMNSGAISTGADHIPDVPIETDTDPAKQSCSVGCSGGILAQSIGGGSGFGGTANAGWFSLGGTAGGGGNASTVEVTNAGDIATQLVNPPGITAQSVAVGGAGAASGNGQNVTVMTNVDPNYRGPTDIITTAGDTSDGILAQSVGEGGGNGGFAVSVTGVAKGVSTAFAMGGNGGAGGNGGSVNVVSNANITTQGNQSAGLFAESAGKGGGNGGLAISGAPSN